RLAGGGRPGAPGTRDEAIGGTGQVDIGAERDVDVRGAGAAGPRPARAGRHAVDHAGARGRAVAVRDREGRAEEAPGQPRVLGVDDPRRGAEAVLMAGRHAPPAGDVRARRAWRWRRRSWSP